MTDSSLTTREAAPAASWPSLEALKAFLRISDDKDDEILALALKIAIQEVIARVDWAVPPEAVPDRLAFGALMLASRLYRRRDSTDGTIGFGEMGVVRIGRWDPDIDALILGGSEGRRTPIG